jgi:hypothetical protein
MVMMLQVDTKLIASDFSSRKRFDGNQKDSELDGLENWQGNVLLSQMALT